MIQSKISNPGIFPQLFGIYPNDTYRQVAKSVSISIFLTISQLNLEIIPTVDIDTVFLNADIDDNIWVKIPKGTNLAANDDGIHKLHKSLYGLKQAITN